MIDFSVVADSSTAYNNEKTVEVDGLTIHVKGQLSGADKSQFTGEASSIALGKKTDDGSFIEITGITKGVGTLSLEYYANDVARTATVKVGSSEQTITPAAKNTMGTWSYDFNDASATSVVITPDTEARRISIANLKWTNKE